MPDVARIHTPIGVVSVVADRDAVLRVMLGDCDPPGEDPDPGSLAALVARRLARYFRGEPVDLDVPVQIADLPGFTRQVLTVTRDIPRGRVASYSEVAALAGNERAVRATGTALGRNPVPLLIPCHRVVARCGRPGGFGSGLAVKRYLLELEGVADIRW